MKPGKYLEGSFVPLNVSSERQKCESRNLFVRPFGQLTLYEVRCCRHASVSRPARRYSILDPSSVELTLSLGFRPGGVAHNSDEESTPEKSAISATT